MVWTCDAEIERWVVREPEDDDWDYGESDGTVVGVTAHEVPEGQYKSPYTASVDFPPPFFAVAAGYYTGSTFGTDFDAQVMGIFRTYEEAEALVKEAREVVTFGQLSNGVFVPWTGYFESLRDLDIFLVDKI